MSEYDTSNSNPFRSIYMYFVIVQYQSKAEVMSGLALTSDTKTICSISPRFT